VLLAAFFLYNPFFAVCAPSGASPAVQHPLSYRSTVASSELGCSAIRYTKLYFSPLEALVGAAGVLLQQQDPIRRGPADETVRAVPQDLWTSLRFRPPPILLPSPWSR